MADDNKTPPAPQPEFDYKGTGPVQSTAGGIATGALIGGLAGTAVDLSISLARGSRDGGPSRWSGLKPVQGWGQGWGKRIGAAAGAAVGGYLGSETAEAGKKQVGDVVKSWAAERADVTREFRKMESYTRDLEAQVAAKNDPNKTNGGPSK